MLPQEFRFSIRAVDGLLLPVPGHPEFGAASAIQFTAAWLPGPSPAAQNQTFVVFVSLGRSVRAV